MKITAGPASHGGKKKVKA